MSRDSCCYGYDHNKECLVGRVSVIAALLAVGPWRWLSTNLERAETVSAPVYMILSTFELLRPSGVLTQSEYYEYYPYSLHYYA